MPLTLLIYPGPADRRYAEPLALPIFFDQRPPRRVAGRVDWRRGGIISQWLEEVSWRESDFHLLYHPGRAFPSLLLRPCGSLEELTGQRRVKILAELVRALSRAGAIRFSVAVLDLCVEDYPLREFAEEVFEGLTAGLAGASRERVEQIRLLWREEDAEGLVRELRRFRHHQEATRGWEIELEPW